MAKYLILGTYTLDGAREVLREGGIVTRDRFLENVRNLGGRVEAFYYAFGETDLYTIVDLPDNVSAAALAMGLGTGGTVKMTTVVLLTPEETELVKEKVPLVRPHHPRNIS
jgi:uncharacterized protein with GYD domain